MLILIAGITGNIGQKLAIEAETRGHAVRGLGRNRNKLSRNVDDKLESFVETKSYYDIAAIEAACNGVDAVICAYSGIPQLQLDGQLILLRAAERAGVQVSLFSFDTAAPRWNMLTDSRTQRFHAASWNAYWPALSLGDHESMDPYLCFAAHARISSPIKPIYLFTGVLMEVFFSLPGHGDLSPANHGLWDPSPHKRLVYWGEGDEPWNFTTERDAAAYSIELVTDENAAEGGYFKVHSGSYSPLEVKAIYETARGVTVDTQRLGGIDDLRALALKERSEGDPLEWWKYIGLYYQLLVLEGGWVYDERDTICSKYPNINRSNLEQFLKQNSEV